jgi:hypothetical protein
MIKALFFSRISNIDRRSGSSYFWLVKFENGAVIPYPLMNLEGIHASPYVYGDIEKSIKERALIVLQEALIRWAYLVRPSLRKTFFALADQVDLS